MKKLLVHGAIVALLAVIACATHRGVWKCPWCGQERLVYEGPSLGACHKALENIQGYNDDEGHCFCSLQCKNAYLASKGATTNQKITIEEKNQANITLTNGVASQVSVPLANRGRLGILIQDINDEIAKQFGVKQTAGAIVAQVTEGSAAAKADIRVGDIITKCNGVAIGNAKDLSSYIAQTAPGQKVVINLIRKDRPLSITAIVGSASE
jgi:hypothetical protein